MFNEEWDDKRNQAKRYDTKPKWGQHTQFPRIKVTDEEGQVHNEDLIEMGNHRSINSPNKFYNKIIEVQMITLINY